MGEGYSGPPGKDDEYDDASRSLTRRLNPVFGQRRLRSREGEGS